MGIPWGGLQKTPWLNEILGIRRINHISASSIELVCITNARDQPSRVELRLGDKAEESARNVYETENPHHYIVGNCRVKPAKDIVPKLPINTRISSPLLFSKRASKVTQRIGIITGLSIESLSIEPERLAFYERVGAEGGSLKLPTGHSDQRLNVTKPIWGSIKIEK